MSKYDKEEMSQRLYSIRIEMEEKFYSSRFFSMDSEIAAELICQKIGTFQFIAEKTDEKKLKNYLEIDYELFNRVDFLQKSLNEIFKGITLMNEHNNICDQYDIKIEEILDLMSIGYKLAIFRELEVFHGRGVFKISCKGNRINFNYINNESVKYNTTYDTFYRKLETDNNIKKLKKSNICNFIDAMNFTHSQIFQVKANINFGDFTTEDYIEFTTGLNRIVSEELYQVEINANNYGFIKYDLDEWINKIQVETTLNSKKIKEIILFLVFDFSDKHSDISLSYFIPIGNKYMLLCSFFLMQRLDMNIVKLLHQKNRKHFDTEQKKFEEDQIIKLKTNLSNNFLVEHGKKALPGIDLLVYDSNKKVLQIIELKFKLPIDTPQEIIKLDQQNIKKALLQNKKAKNFIDEKKVLGEYFGKFFKNVEPERIQYFTLTNYSIGLGTNFELPTSILLMEHYLDCMGTREGVDVVGEALERKDKGLFRKFTIKYSKLKLGEYKLVIPINIANFINK